MANELAIRGSLLDDIHSNCINPKTREVWLHSVDTSGPGYDGDEVGVEHLMAVRFAKNMHFLKSQSKTKPVTIYMSTCGGFFEQGIFIYDTIMSMPFPVTIVNCTHARSMSSIILQAADWRIMLPNSLFMFHWGTVSADGHAITVYSEVDYTRKIQDKKMIDIYVESCKNGDMFKNKTENQIRTVLENQMNKRGDVYLTAEESIEWGFADEIL